MVVVLLSGITLQRYTFILYIQNKNGIIFAYFVKFYWNVLVCPRLLCFFCVARENLRPRHAVKFSMPCVWRGVKENYSWQCVMSGSMARRLRRYDRFPQIPVPSFSPLCKKRRFCKISVFDIACFCVLQAWYCSWKCKNGHEIAALWYVLRGWPHRRKWHNCKRMAWKLRRIHSWQRFFLFSDTGGLFQPASKWKKWDGRNQKSVLWTASCSIFPRFCVLWRAPIWGENTR